MQNLLKKMLWVALVHVTSPNLGLAQDPTDLLISPMYQHVPGNIYYSMNQSNEDAARKRREEEEAVRIENVRSETVVRSYQDCLGRDPSPIELTHYVNFGRNMGEVERLRQRICGSKEAADRNLLTRKVATLSQGNSVSLRSLYTSNGSALCADDGEASQNGLFYAHPCHGRSNQKLRFNSASRHLVMGDKCVDVNPGTYSRWRGAKSYEVYLNPNCYDIPNQRFSIEANHWDGSLTLRSDFNNLCLNIHWGQGPLRRVNGYAIVAFPCNDQSHQHWTVD